MSEEQIERMVERKTDRLDYLFTRGAIGQLEYDRQSKEISEEAKRLYRRAS